MTPTPLDTATLILATFVALLCLARYWQSTRPQPNNRKDKHQ